MLKPSAGVEKHGCRAFLFSVTHRHRRSYCQNFLMMTRPMTRRISSWPRHRHTSQSGEAVGIGDMTSNLARNYDGALLAELNAYIISDQRNLWASMGIDIASLFDIAIIEIAHRSIDAFGGIAPFRCFRGTCRKSPRKIAIETTANDTASMPATPS